MFIMKKRNSVFQRWYIPVLRVISYDGKTSYEKHEINILVDRLDTVHKLMPADLLNSWEKESKIGRGRLISKMKREFLNPELL